MTLTVTEALGLSLQSAVEEIGGVCVASRHTYRSYSAAVHTQRCAQIIGVQLSEFSQCEHTT